MKLANQPCNIYKILMCNVNIMIASRFVYVPQTSVCNYHTVFIVVLICHSNNNNHCQRWTVKFLVFFLVELQFRKYYWNSNYFRYGNCAIHFVCSELEKFCEIKKENCVNFSECLKVKKLFFSIKFMFYIQKISRVNFLCVRVVHRSVRSSK